MQHSAIGHDDAKSPVTFREIRSDRADTLFAQWLAGYLKSSVWEALNAAHRQHPDWSRAEMEDFRKAMASHLSSRMQTLRRERDEEFAVAPRARARP
jgi:hypothetical protein